MKYIIFILALSLFSVSCGRETDTVIQSQHKFFAAVASNDIALSETKEGEWLYEHKEPGQTFEEYKKNSIVHPTDSANVIFIKPYGKFTEEEQRILTFTADYLSVFFQLKVELEKPVTDEVIPVHARRRRNDGTEQLLAPYFLDTLLKHNLPKTAVVAMAITEKDLYPKNDWNFIFGLASYQERVGVCSMQRLHNGALDSSSFSLCLSRLIGISSHEIGHMFSLHHCTYAKCIMNGSNSLAETDTQPNRLCSECLKKLYWNFRFDNKIRLQTLLKYFYDHHLERDYLLAKADCDAMAGY